MCALIVVWISDRICGEGRLFARPSKFGKVPGAGLLDPQSKLLVNSDEANCF